MAYARRLPAACLLDAETAVDAAADALAARAATRPRLPQPSPAGEPPRAVEDPPRRHGRDMPGAEPGSTAGAASPAGTPKAPLTRDGADGTQPRPAHPWPVGTIVTWPGPRTPNLGVITGAARDTPDGARRYFVLNAAAPRSPVTMPADELTYQATAAALAARLTAP